MFHTIDVLSFPSHDPLTFHAVGPQSRQAALTNARREPTQLAVFNHGSVLICRLLRRLKIAFKNVGGRTVLRGMRERRTSLAHQF